MQTCTINLSNKLSLLPHANMRPNTSYGYAPHFRGLINLSLAYLQCYAPREIELKTGKLILLLANFPDGLSKAELLSKFYNNFTEASCMRQHSLEASLDKVIQRARVKYKKVGINIVFDKLFFKFFLVPIACELSKKTPLMQNLQH